jgi:nitroimidazol reductase NimA-like FMN-containing flavoprotein (pyridoxamine 5'-phosphate oxidase superfamily)
LTFEDCRKGKIIESYIDSAGQQKIKIGQQFDEIIPGKGKTMTPAVKGKSKSAQSSQRIKKNTKSRECLEKEILKFLNKSSSKRGQQANPEELPDNGLGCVLATSRNNIPRATPVDFYNDGLIIWIIGDPGKKILNIRSNNRVSVGVYHPMDRSKPNRSLQIQGKARLVNYKDHKKVFFSAAKKFGIMRTIENMADKQIQKQLLSQEESASWIERTLSRFNLIRIIPDEITCLFIHPVKGIEKDVWKKRTARTQ